MQGHRLFIDKVETIYTEEDVTDDYPECQHPSLEDFF